MTIQFEHCLVCVAKTSAIHVKLKCSRSSQMYCFLGVLLLVMLSAMKLVKTLYFLVLGVSSLKCFTH